MPSSIHVHSFVRGTRHAGHCVILRHHLLQHLFPVGSVAFCISTIGHPRLYRDGPNVSCAFWTFIILPSAPWWSDILLSKDGWMALIAQQIPVFSFTALRTMPLYFTALDLQRRVADQKACTDGLSFAARAFWMSMTTAFAESRVSCCSI